MGMVKLLQSGLTTGVGFVGDVSNAVEADNEFGKEMWKVKASLGTIDDHHKNVGEAGNNEIGEETTTRKVAFEEIDKSVLF